MIRASVVFVAAVMLLHYLPTAESAEARKPGGSAARVVIAANSESIPPSEVQKVQRLLKFLSERSPARFSKVDPGPVDGIFGSEVKAAIIKFQRIVGAPINPVIDRELLSQIILALAETPDASESSLAGCAENPSNPACTEATTAAATVPAKARIVTRMFVQVASLPSLARAKREWRRLKRTNSAVLSDTPVDFRQVEIKGRGTYFRIFVGPYSNMADARNICVGLGRSGRNCIVVRRKITLVAKPAQPAEPPADQEKKATAAAKPDQPVGPQAPLEKKAEVPDGPKVTETTGLPTPPSPGPEQSARTDAEIPSLTLQSPILIPGALPMAPKPDVAADRGTDTAPVETKSAKTDPEPQAAQTAQPKSATSEPTETAAAPTKGSTTKAEDTPGDARPVDAESSTAAGTTPSDTASMTPESPSHAAPEKSVPASGAAGAAAPAAAAPAKKTTAAAADGKKKSKSGESKAKEKSKAAVGPLGVLFSRLPRLTWPRLLILGAIAAGGFGFYVFWRRRRMRASKRGVPVNLPKEMSEVWTSAMEESERDKPATFDDLQSDFESPQMRQSRDVRDAFLRDILENDDIETTNGANREAALSVNRGLKHLLESDPARYKQIFFNWLFMDRIGAALDQHELSADELDEPINREFALLRSYFRIHLLELDDRHRLRSSLPGLFHCLVFPRP